MSFQIKLERKLDKLKIRRATDKIAQGIIDDLHDIGLAGYTNVARSKTGHMRGLIGGEKQKDGVKITFGTKYAQHVDRRYGISPSKPPTGLKLANQTHKGKPKGATVREVAVEVIKEVMRRQ